jgi:ERCC4-related helicase
MAAPELLAETNIRPRAYQLEMLEESLKGNIIVAVSEAMSPERWILTK